MAPTGHPQFNILFCSFDAVAGVSQEANNEAISALTGVDVDDIFVANWSNSPFRPCHYVAADKANKCIVISVRGSLELGDLMSDVAAHPLEIKLMDVEGWVHQGIMSAATYIQCSVKEALEEAAGIYPGWPVLVTGHSLGGGVASILTMLLHQAGGIQGLGKIRCITIGTAAVMSRPLAAACDDISISVVLGSDPVPHLSYASVENLLLEMSKASPVKKAAEELGNKFCDLIGIAKKSDNVQEQFKEPKSSLWGSMGAAKEQASGKNIGLAELKSLAEKIPNKEKSDSIIKVIEAPKFPEPSARPSVNPEQKMLQVVEYVPESDATLVSSAQAREHSRSEKNSEIVEQNIAGSPEILFPAGKILWILCNEGDLDQPSTTVDDIDNLWDASWQGLNAEGREVKENKKSPGMTETKGKENGGSVVALANRDTFERILLLTSMLDDHLPDRYLDALQQL